jgi:hypothetical protein
MGRVLIAVLALIACDPSERVDRDIRDTPGGAFQATCTATLDCGCHDAHGDDAFCERESTQLQCLGFGGSSKCTLTCTSTSDCTTLFGSGTTCNLQMICQR